MARSVCIYGPTGTYKTTQAKHFARYIARLTGKCTKLASLDGGGWGPCNPEIRAGMIDAYHVETAMMPMILLRKLSQGYWPVDPLETDPAKINLRPVDWSEFGGYILEGWTSISEVFMGFLPDKGIDVGGESRSKLGGFTQQVHVDDQVVTESFRSNTRGDYREVQKDLHGLVHQFNSLPVHCVLHTALEARGKEEDGKTTYGPAIAGQKATGQCGPWVGDLLHAQEYTVTRKVKVPDPADKAKEIEEVTADSVVRYYFKRQLDAETGIPYPAKPRIAPEKMRELEKRFPGGYFEPKLDGTDTLAAYLETVDKLDDAASDDAALKEWRAKMDAKLGRGKPKPPEASAASAT